MPVSTARIPISGKPEIGERVPRAGWISVARADLAATSPPDDNLLILAHRH
ncbi:hypothetical protein BOSEA31B_10951 [Hyphomicrobiales bacterium]|nr:hypothetical protein BOSEA31B_10951 [Hyphomicrobiales bacterium]